MKTRIGLLLCLALLGGCVYGPGYYSRSGVVYDDGTAVYSSAPAAGYGYGYGYGAWPGYSSPWCCYGSPWFGLGLYGNYYYGGHYRYHNHGGWHGGGHQWDGHSLLAPRPVPNGGGHRRKN